jgi:hypothetical protein
VQLKLRALASQRSSYRGGQRPARYRRKWHAMVGLLSCMQHSARTIRLFFMPRMWAPTMKRYVEIIKETRRIRAKGYPTNLVRALWLGHTTEMSALWCAHKGGKAKFHLELKVY